jgi:predicted benzoate:H+ symporter BenE
MKKLQFIMRQPSARFALAAGLVTSATAAHADTGAFDVSAIVSTLTAAGVACASVGIAYLGVVGGIRTYKLIRTAF